MKRALDLLYIMKYLPVQGWERYGSVMWVHIGDHCIRCDRSAILSYKGRIVRNDTLEKICTYLRSIYDTVQD